MNLRVLTLPLLVLVAAVAVPLGAALGFDGRAPRSPLAPPAAVRHVTAGPLHVLPEAGTVALTGVLLLGLAAVVRRTP